MDSNTEAILRRRHEQLEWTRKHAGELVQDYGYGIFAVCDFKVVGWSEVYEEAHRQAIKEGHAANDFVLVPILPPDARISPTSVETS